MPRPVHHAHVCNYGNRPLEGRPQRGDSGTCRVTLPRQEAHAKPRNAPPAAPGDSGVPNAAALSIHEQTVLGWLLSPANHIDAEARLADLEVQHFYSIAHQEIYAAISVHIGVPNISTLVAVDLATGTTHRAVRALAGGVISYLSECKEHADLLGLPECAYHVARFGRRTDAGVDSRFTPGPARRSKRTISPRTTLPWARCSTCSPTSPRPTSKIESQVDWDDAFARDFTRMDWLPGRFLERGQQITLVGDGKVGKSLFVLDWVFKAVTGRPFIGDISRRPIKVSYFDRENSLRDVVTRAQAFGATADDFRALLSYRQFPRFSGTLDESQQASREFLAVIDQESPDVVVLDTASRFIGGKENDSDTWLQLYQLVHEPLKARGVACVRLDHFGKDSDKGSRGSSAKTQDVDHVWEMRRVDERKTVANGVERIATTIRLSRPYTRTGLGEDEFMVVRRGEKQVGGLWLPGRTSHELAEPGALETIRGEVDRVVDDLIGASVPAGLGRDKLKSWMALKGLPTFNNALMADVVRELKDRQS
ncbi:AAA family ATPase [Actinoplanes sp. NPDC051513]|uniref:AAA family ATPase n=1 Tax=Actinoplanes sp. NPDC051513 TaxID=3363908 RepID=UPI0037BC2FB4